MKNWRGMNKCKTFLIKLEHVWICRKRNLFPSVSFEYLDRQWSKWSDSSKTIKRLPTVDNIVWWIIYLIGNCHRHNANKIICIDYTCFCLPHMTQQETFKIHFIYQIAMLLPVERILCTFFIASISFISSHMFADAVSTA